MSKKIKPRQQKKPRNLEIPTNNFRPNMILDRKDKRSSNPHNQRESGA